MTMYASIVAGFVDALNPKEAARRHALHKQWCEQQLVHAEAWTDDMKWKKTLVLKGDTYKPRRLFLVKPCTVTNINDAPRNQILVSPCKRWCYAERVWPRATDLPTMSGRNTGVVIFDKDIALPALYEADPHRGERWKVNTWMSHTPMEIMTLRPGTKRAKGKTIVAGLGLGHQLIEVSHRKQVKEVVLVERDRGLVRWLLPRIKPFMGPAPLTVVVGDAYTVLPKMTADVALVDIFPSYGGNEGDRDRLRKECKNIGFIWAWGCGAWR